MTLNWNYTKILWKSFFSFLKIRGRQLCLNGRKGCNSIVTYYGFTILDLVRLQEGEQYREESL